MYDPGAHRVAEQNHKTAPTHPVSCSSPHRSCNSTADRALPGLSGASIDRDFVRAGIAFHSASLLTLWSNDYFLGRCVKSPEAALTSDYWKRDFLTRIRGASL